MAGLRSEDGPRDQNSADVSFRSNLTAKAPHSVEVVGFCRSVLGGQRPPQMTGLPLIAYSLLGTSAFYMADGKTIVESPHVSPELDSSLRGHLGEETMLAWRGMQPAVKSHIDSVASLWQEDTAFITERGRTAGLVPVEKFSSEDVDFVWPGLLVQVVWSEATGRTIGRTLPWSDSEIVEELAAISMRHTLDTVQTWVIRGTNMARSQSREPIETVRVAWKQLLDDTGPRIRQLTLERASIESAAGRVVEAFEGFVARFESSSTLQGTCDYCERDGKPA